MRTLMKQNRLSRLFIKDEAEPFEMNNLKPMKIHGRTDITLKNVKTGLVERFHSENTFQAWALANYTKEHGVFRVNSGFDWTELVGGIYLFRDQITVGSEYMPAGNEMIGSGSYGMTNAGQCTEFGSFNGADSSATPFAIRQTYEYNTSQANGNISCVCLGNRYGAQIGYGYRSGYIQGEYNMNPGYRNENSGRTGERNQMYYNGFVYTWNGVDENHIAHIGKKRYSASVGSIFHDLSGNELTFDMTEVGQPWTDFVESGSCYALNAGDVGGGVFRINPYGNAYSTTHTVAPGGTAYYYEFDCANETLTLKTFTNSSSSTLNWTGCACRFFSDYIVVMTTDESAYCCIFKQSTGEFLRKLRIYNSFGPRDGDRDIPPSEIADGLLVFHTLASEIRQGASGGAFGIYDCVADTFKAIALPWSYPDRHYAVGTQMKTVDIMKNESYAANATKFHNPFYLATINNLDETVPKTAAKSMKVVYTLTAEA